MRQRKVVSNKLFPKIRRLYGELYRCGLCPSAPLPLCVKIILSQSRDSFPNLVNPVNPVKKVRLSVPLCLCVNFITETLRHRVFFILLCPPAPLRLSVKNNSVCSVSSVVKNITQTAQAILAVRALDCSNNFFHTAHIFFGIIHETLDKRYWVNYILERLWRN